MITKVCKCPIPVTAYCHACGGLVKEKDNKKTLREEFEEKFVTKSAFGSILGNPKNIGNETQDVEDIWNWFESKLTQREAEVRGEEIKKIEANLAGLFPVNQIKVWTSEEVIEYIQEFLQSLNQHTNEKTH